jgi:hypothetical protein
MGHQPEMIQRSRAGGFDNSFSKLFVDGIHRLQLHGTLHEGELAFRRRVAPATLFQLPCRCATATEKVRRFEIKLWLNC